MSSFTGMNIAEIRSLAARFSQAAEEMGSTVALVSSGLNAVSWVGQDAERVRGGWAEHRRALAAAAAFLVDASERMTKNANEQESTSRVD